jgi:hypothetical protein
LLEARTPTSLLLCTNATLFLPPLTLALELNELVHGVPDTEATATCCIAIAIAIAIASLKHFTSLHFLLQILPSTTTTTSSRESDNKRGSDHRAAI